MIFLRTLLALLILATTPNLHALGVEYSAGTYRFLDDQGELLLTVAGFPPEKFPRLIGRSCWVGGLLGRFAKDYMNSSRFLEFFEGIYITHPLSADVECFLNFDLKKDPNTIRIRFLGTILHEDLVVACNHQEIIDVSDLLSPYRGQAGTTSLRDLTPIAPTANLNKEGNIELNGALQTSFDG